MSDESVERGLGMGVVKPEALRNVGDVIQAKVEDVVWEETRVWLGERDEDADADPRLTGFEGWHSWEI